MARALRVQLVGAKEEVNELKQQLGTALTQLSDSMASHQTELSGLQTALEDRLESERAQHSKASMALQREVDAQRQRAESLMQELSESRQEAESTREELERRNKKKAAEGHAVKILNDKIRQVSGRGRGRWCAWFKGMVGPASAPVHHTHDGIEHAMRRGCTVWPGMDRFSRHA